MANIFFCSLSQQNMFFQYFKELKIIRTQKSLGKQPSFFTPGSSGVKRGIMAYVYSSTVSLITSQFIARKSSLMTRFHGKQQYQSIFLPAWVAPRLYFQPFWACDCLSSSKQGT